MDPIISAKRAFEIRLNTLGLPTAYENVEFKPVSGQKYLEVQYVIKKPDDPVIGDKYYREMVQAQVFICDKLNIGTTSALETAGQIRSLFPKGITLVQDRYNIYTFNTPQVKGSSKINDRLVVPVIIDLVVEIYN